MKYNSGINYTLDEFVKVFGKDYNVKKKDFDKQIYDVCKKYGIPIERIRRDQDDTANYEIPFELAELLALLLWLYKKDPFYDERRSSDKKSTDDYQTFVDECHAKVANLPNHIQEWITDQVSYRAALVTSKLMPLLIDRLSFLLYITNLTAPDILWTSHQDLIDRIDDVIFSHTMDHLAREMKMDEAKRLLPISPDKLPYSSRRNNAPYQDPKSKEYSFDSIFGTAFNDIYEHIVYVVQSGITIADLIEEHGEDYCPRVFEPDSHPIFSELRHYKKHEKYSADQTSALREAYADILDATSVQQSAVPISEYLEKLNSACSNISQTYAEMPLLETEEEYLKQKPSAESAESLSSLAENKHKSRSYLHETFQDYRNRKNSVKEENPLRSLAQKRLNCRMFLHENYQNFHNNPHYKALRDKTSSALGQLLLDQFR